MAEVTFNTNPKRRIPINRNNLFYSDEAYAYDIDMGKNYIEQDLNQTVVVYQVEVTSTNVDALYGETKSGGVKYKTPVEVPCRYEVLEPELKAYDKTKNLGTYMKTGKLKVYVYQESLDELGADIKKGDYIGVVINENHIEMFVVNNDGKNNYDNAHTMYGTRPFYRTVEASPVDKSEIEA